MLLVQPLSTGRVFLPFPFPTRSHFSKMICDNLKNWPPKHSQKHCTQWGQNLQDTPCTISRRDSLCPHTKPADFLSSRRKTSESFSNFFFMLKRLKSRLTLSHSDPPLFLLPYYYNTKKKQSIPSTPLYNFPKGLYFLPHKTHLFPLMKKLYRNIEGFVALARDLFNFDFLN